MSETVSQSIKFVLCDMDDTVLVHRPYADALWLDVLQRFQLGLDSDSTSRLYEAIVDERHAFWSDPGLSTWGRLEMTKARTYFVTKAVARVSLRVDEAQVKRLVKEFSTRRDNSVTLPKENRDALLKLKEYGVLLALVTNGQGDAQRDKVNRFGLSEVFDSIIIEGEIGVGKPDWRVYQLALDSLHATVERTVMVGDNWEWEVVAPSQHGLRALWIQSSDILPPEPLDAGFIGQIESFAQVPSILSERSLLE